MKIIDKKAKQILFETYWSSTGWKSERSTAPQDFDYALKAGYMFNQVSFSHDEIVDKLIKVAKKIKTEQVSNAFLSSLSSRGLSFRSALGSYAIARNFPKHKFVGDYICNICGAYLEDKEIDLNVLNFERLKWGGVRHLSPVFVWFDLEQFVSDKIQKPILEDFEIFDSIIKSARSIEENTRPNDLEKAISKIFPSNKDERRVLIEILGFCGILQPQKQQGFFESFVNYNKREERPVNKIDWAYPVSWWRGSDGVNNDALTFFFPQKIEK